MQIRVAFIMLMMLGITINALTSDDALDVVPEEFIADDVVSEILLMQTPEPDKVAPKNTSKYISHPVEHLRHVHEKMQGIRTVHKASEDTQTKLAEVTGLLAVATQQTPSSSHNHSALDTAISTAINAISNDLSSGHSTDSTYISNLYTSSTNAVSTSVSNSLTAVNTKKSEWCPAKRALEDAQSTKSTKQTTLQNLFTATAAMKSTCSKTWTESKPTVESAFDSVTAAKSSYTTAKTEYDNAVTAESSATTTESQKSSAFTTTLNNEATNTNSQCANTVSSYSSAKNQVSSNVATRKHTKTLLEYLRCYLRDVLDGTATAAEVQACQDATVDTTSYDITMSDMATCATVDALKASWGPVGWTPTLANCHANGGAAAWTLKSPAPSCPTTCGTAASVLPKYDCVLTHSSQSTVPVDASRCGAQPSDFNLACSATSACTSSPTSSPTATPSAPPPPSSTSMLSPPAKIYAIGGRSGDPSYNPRAERSVEMFDGVTNTWSAGPNLPSRNIYGSSVFYDNKIWVIGGWDGDWVDTVLYFDGTWHTSSRSLPAVRGMAATAVLNNQIYVVGGYGTGHAKHGTMLVGDGTSAWNSVDLVEELTNTGVAAYRGKLYVFGGQTGSGKTDKMRSYDGSAWQDEPSMLGFRTGFGYAVFNDRIYVAGGAGGPDPTSRTTIGTVEYFDGTSWTQGPALSIARDYTSMAPFNNKLYIVGGYAPFTGCNINSCEYSHSVETLSEGATSWSTSSGWDLHAGRDLYALVTANPSV